MKNAFDPSRLPATADLFGADQDAHDDSQELASAHKLAKHLQERHRELAEQIVECNRDLVRLRAEEKGTAGETQLVAKLASLRTKREEVEQELAEIEALIDKQLKRSSKAGAGKGNDSPGIDRQADTHASEQSTEDLAKELEALREKNLLPIRHRNRDFFLADLFDYAMKDDGVSMEAPIFTLSTKPDTTEWEWTSKDGKKQILVTPSVKGRATQHDKDVLIYVISQLTAAFNMNAAAAAQGKPEPRPDARNRTIRLKVYDYLVTTNKGVGGADYDRLMDAFVRLRGTTITTNIRTGGQLTKETFGIIERAKIVVNSAKNDRMEIVEVTISEWLYNAVQAFEVLTIHPDYFRLRKPLERRLYELARKHCGKQEQWIISLAGLKEKAGSKSSLREFRRMVNEIAAASTLPEYGFEVGEDDMVIFFRKAPLPTGALQAP